MRPTPETTPSIAALRTWLHDCATELVSLERKLSVGASTTRRSGWGQSSSDSSSETSTTLSTLSVRLALISELLAAQRAGAALEEPEQQLLELLLSHSLDRLAQMAPLAAPAPDPPATAAELPIELPLPPGS